jgi:toxin ParE1/3/4
MQLIKTPRAEQDLLEIWLYTYDYWGSVQADKYLAKIEKCFENICTKKARLKILIEDVYYIRCEHHYILILMEDKPAMIAVLHEKMDLMARLKDRLI